MGGGSPFMKGHQEGKDRPQGLQGTEKRVSNGAEGSCPRIYLSSFKN